MHLGYCPTHMRPIVFVVLLSVVCSLNVSLHALPAIHGCAQASLQVNERAGGVTFELTRSQNTTGTTTGYVRVLGDWKLHVDRLTATFAPGETTRFVDILWDNDAVYSDTQRARFICGGQGPGVSDQTFEGTIVLTDDEPYPALVAPARIEVTETDTPQHITIPFSFVPPFDYPRGLSVVLDHITTNDRDVKSLTAYATDEIELEIAGDDEPESDESVSVRLVGEAQKGITLTIRDDDRPPFPYTFDRDSYEFDEAQGGGSIVVQRTGSLSSPAQLLLRIRPTIPGVEIEEIPVLLDQGRSSKEVLLALDDAYFTGPRYGILELELEGFVGATASFTVQDDEAMPSLSVGDGSVREGNLDQHPRLEVPVTLTAPLGTPLQLTLTPSHVSTDAADFAALPATVTISPGELAATAVFEVNGDIDLEPDETFTVTATLCCDGLAALTRPSGTATIVNDDSAPAESVYRLALGATTFKEQDLWLTIPVRRFGRVSGTSRVILKLTAADERVFAPRTVTFAPNETANDVRVFINDFWYSGDTTVKVELFDGDRLLETASVSIVDNETGPWLYGYGAGYEHLNAVPLTITLTPPSAKPVIVRLHARTGGAAKYGDDFLPFDTTVEIPPFTNTYVVPVPIRDDRIAEETEAFIVDLVHSAGPVTGSGGVFIYDDDTGYVESEPNVLRGTLTTITVHFPSPAPAKDTILFLANPNVLEGPMTVPVSVGASSVSFQALAKTSGTLPFAIEAPAFLQSKRIPRVMTIYDAQSLTLDPAALELAPGESARVVLTTGSDQPGFTMQSGDWTIAATQTSEPVDGKRAFFVHANVPGQTEIVVKLPTPGGETVRLPVVVKEPPVPVTRRRAAGH